MVPSSSNTTPCPIINGLGDRASKIMDVEEEFHKSISTLVSTVIMEGAKIPRGGRCGIDFQHLLASANFTLGPSISTKY